MLKVLIFFVVIVICAALEAWAESKILLRVTPTVMLQRGDARVEVRVKPDSRNRWLVLSWDSDSGTAGSTQRRIDGEDGPVLFVFEKELTNIPPANYVITATTFASDGKRIATETGRIATPDNK